MAVATHSPARRMCAPPRRLSYPAARRRGRLQMGWSRRRAVKAQLWVESHQPVPLVPLSMLKIEPGDVIYIGHHMTREGERAAPGWVLAGSAGLYVSLTTAEYF